MEGEEKRNVDLIQALRRGWSRWRYLREVWANWGASGPTPSPAIPSKEYTVQLGSWWRWVWFYQPSLLVN